jgi:hypothetical protein
MLRSAIILAVCLAVSACSSGGTPNLINPPPTEGPDEFSILPTKPLETPPNLNALPAPTPGWSNRTDPRPEAEAIAALGGNPAALNRASSDGALLRHTTRYGVASNIRPTLASSDLEYRRANEGRFLERVFNVNTYYKAYESQSLNKYRELDRFRAAGVPTPAVPPPPSDG